MPDILKVKDLKTLKSLKNHKNGEYALCEEDGLLYQYNKTWKEVKQEVNVNGSFQMKQRELLINTLSNSEPLAKFDYNSVKVWGANINSSYYMLLAKELDYYTLFVKDKHSNVDFANEVQECLKILGTLMYIEIPNDEEGPIIFWIKTPEGKITEAYLFNYSKGVVPFNG